MTSCIKMTIRPKLTLFFSMAGTLLCLLAVEASAVNWASCEIDQPPDVNCLEIKFIDNKNVCCPGYKKYMCYREQLCCEPCPEKTFQSRYNECSECHPCTQCDEPEPGSKCTRTSDRKCILVTTSHTRDSSSPSPGSGDYSHTEIPSTTSCPSSSSSSITSTPEETGTPIQPQDSGKPKRWRHDFFFVWFVITTTIIPICVALFCCFLKKISKGGDETDSHQHTWKAALQPLSRKIFKTNTDVTELQRRITSDEQSAGDEAQPFREGGGTDQPDGGNPNE